MAEDPDRSGAGLFWRRVSQEDRLDRYWEKLDPSDGLPTWEALYHFVDPERAVQAYRYAAEHPAADYHYDPTGPGAFRIKFGLRGIHALSNQLVQKLKTGELRARGFANHAALDAPRQEIHKDRWGDLELNVWASRARGSGYEISRILVFDAQPSSAEGRPGKKQYSSAALRAWYIERVKRLVAANKKSARNEDYMDAKADFAGRVTKRPVEALRKELAPESWRKGGRPKTK